MRSPSPSGSLRFIGPLERALFLKSLGPLEDLRPAQVAVFAENAVERSWRAGQVLLRSGRPTGAYHVVVEGGVHATGGEYLDGREIGPREAVGLLSMIARRPDGLDLVAREDTVTLEFEEDVMLDILEDDFSILQSFIRRLARQSLSQRRRIPSGTYLAPREDVLGPLAGSEDLDLVERILMMRGRGTPWQGVGLDGIARLARTTPVVHYPAGTTLWKSGDRAEHMVVIVSGTVSCTTQWGVSRFRAGPGYPLGNLERFAEEPRWYTAVTETPLVALRGETESLMEILEDHFDMALALARAMSERRIQIVEETAAQVRAAEDAATSVEPAA
jgi:CRP-like cAMP-binding protein